MFLPAFGVAGIMSDLFHFALPVTSLFFDPSLSISRLLHESFHLIYVVPLSLFSGIGASDVLLCSSYLLFMCPYNFGLLSGATAVTLQMRSHVHL